MMLTPLHLAAKIARMASEDVAGMVRTEPARSAVVATRVLGKACETAEAPPKNQSSSRLDDFRGEVRALFVAAQSARMEPEDITRMVRTDPARCAADIVRLLAEVGATAETSPKNQLRKTGGMAELRAMTPPSGIFLGDTFRAKHGKDKAARISEKKLAFLDLAGKSLGVNPFQPLDECFAIGLAGSSLRGPFGRESGRRPFFNTTNANGYSGICRVVVSDPIQISPVGGKGSSAKRRPTEVIPATPPTTLDDINELLRQAAATARQSRAKSTQLSYDSALRMFAKFAAKHGQTAFPAAPRTVAAFLQSKINEGAAPGSLNVYLSAIRSVHREGKMPDPTDDLNVRAVAHGYSRIQAALGRRSKQAKGLSEDGLAAIVAVADKDNNIFAIRDTAIMSILREALMRRSECAALRVADFWLASDADGGGYILIRRSKTDQTGKGKIRYLGEQAADCVVKWLEAAPANADDPLFRRIRRGGHVQSDGLTGKSINNIIQSRGKAAGIVGLSGHSGRVGMAQTLVSDGASLVAVMNAGGWASANMVARYTSCEDAANGAVAALRRRNRQNRAAEPEQTGQAAERQIRHLGEQAADRAA